MVKVTFNLLKTKKDKLGRKIYVWRDGKGKGRSRPTKSEITQFKNLRSRASKKRELKKKELKKGFKFHQTRSKNITYDTYCSDYNNGKGITKLQELFKSLGLAKLKHRIRFHVGSWWGFCDDKRAKCPDKLFIAHTKKDKYTMAREQANLTNSNFEGKYISYLGDITDPNRFSAIFQAGAIYKSDVCPQCPSGKLRIEWLKICFQVIKVKS